MRKKNDEAGTQEQETSCYLDALVSPDDKNILDLAETTYTLKQLEQMEDFNGTGTELNALYPFECVRTAFEGYYDVSYLADGHVLSFQIDKETDEVCPHWKIYTMSYFKDDFFENLKVGQTLDDVKAFDSKNSGVYLFLYTGTGEPRISHHYTKDGYVVSILYNEDYIIENMTYSLI